MGPVENVSKELLPTDPPLYDPTSDHPEGRRNIARWVDTIVQGAEKGEYRMYKTVHAIIGSDLYDRGLQSKPKSFVDEVQDTVQINYKQEYHIGAVQEIVELLAVEPNIAIFTRLISTFSRVNSCFQRNNEDSPDFVSRFRGYAADHLMHASVAANSKVGEIHAITLLNNSNLSEETLSNVKM